MESHSNMYRNWWLCCERARRVREKHINLTKLRRFHSATRSRCVHRTLWNNAGRDAVLGTVAQAWAVAFPNYLACAIVVNGAVVSLWSQCRFPPRPFSLSLYSRHEDDFRLRQSAYSFNLHQNSPRSYREIIKNGEMRGRVWRYYHPMARYPWFLPAFQLRFSLHVRKHRWKNISREGKKARMWFHSTLTENHFSLLIDSQSESSIYNGMMRSSQCTQVVCTSFSFLFLGFALPART